jgi:hypothetical protein
LFFFAGGSGIFQFVRGQKASRVSAARIRRFLFADEHRLEFLLQKVEIDRIQHPAEGRCIVDDSSGIQPPQRSEFFCALCGAREKSPLIVLQGTISDYYFCKICRNWYEIFLESSIVRPVSDRRRIKALQYYFTAQFEPLRAAREMRDFFVSLYYRAQDLCFWLYRRICG